MALTVQVDDDIPAEMAPSPSPWERQSHLGKRAQSFDSLDSGENRPPSYNYVMKKSDGVDERAPLLTADDTGSGGISSPGHQSTSPTGSSYIETSC